MNQVGSGADDEADDAGYFQGLLVKGLEFFQGFVGVGEGLEVGQVLACAAVSSLVELDAFFDLLADAFFGLAVGGVEGLVAAEGTPPGAEGAVAVGAGESRVDADFLHPTPELPVEIIAIAVVSSHGCRFCVAAFCKNKYFYYFCPNFSIWNHEKSGSDSLAIRIRYDKIYYILIFRIFDG